MRMGRVVSLGTAAFICTVLGVLHTTSPGLGAEAVEGEAAPVARDAPFKRLAGEVVRSAGIHVGLVVHLNVTDGRLSAALAECGEFVVHGVAPTAETAQKARQYLHSRGLHGTVSVEHGDLSRLPYVENLVNLVVVEDFTDAQKKGLSLEEVMRVLCPRGTAWLGEKDAPAKVVRKERPPEMDEWTHWLHDPGCTNLSSDALVGPGARLQWMDGPNWLTAGHVTELFAGGRAFNVMGVRRGPDEADCVLIARDAFNGMVLWKRVLATGRSRYSPHVVVAAGERVFALLKKEKDESLVALDAATGEVVRTYDLGMSPRSVLYLDGRLIVAAEKAICSVDAGTGELKWRVAAPENAAFRFTTPLDYSQYPHLVSGDGRLFVFVEDAPEPPYSLVCYDAATGEEKWRRKHPGELLKCYMGVLALVDQPTTFSFKTKTLGTIHGVSTEDGRGLWKHENIVGLHSDANAACTGGLFWLNADGKGLVGLDPATGSERKRLKIQMTGYCGYVRTTERHFIGVFSRFVSTETGESFDAGCYKNACGVGQVPANGMVYTFPIACACCPYLRGFLAMAPAAAEQPAEAPEIERLEKGPAYGVEPKRPTAGVPPTWSTFRHDPQRSGSTAEAIPHDLKPLWSQTVTDSERTPYGKSMTPPVVAEGKVFVAAPDAHQVCALDAKTGEVRWRFLLDGRVEVPPTIHEGLCLFGANDGWVYCLRAADGEVVWRFRAAPAGRRILVRGRLESPWPVPGVLMTGGVAYFAAGRHARGPEGISLYALEPATGKLLWRKHLQRIRSWKDSFIVNDLLVADGRSLFMSIWRYDPGTGESSGNWRDVPYLRGGSGLYGGGCAVLPFGLLYDRRADPWLTFPWPYRGVHGTHGPWSEPTYWNYRGARGLMLAFTGDTVFGVLSGKSTSAPWQLFARRPDAARPADGAPLWSVSVPPRSVQAILPAGPTLFVAGVEGEHGGKLTLYSTDNGEKLGELGFSDVPVFDGMAAADGRLYVCTENGRAFCFGRK